MGGRGVLRLRQSGYDYYYYYYYYYHYYYYYYYYYYPKTHLPAKGPESEAEGGLAGRRP